MWSPNLKNITPNEEFDEENEYDDDAWELTRAFVEDTRNTNWPPRSYTCTFCRREFRSAQALGGHMNIHRRDRAHQAQAQAQDQVIVTGSTSSSGFFYGCGGGESSGLFYGQLSNYGFQSVNSFGVSYNPLRGDNVSHNYEEGNYDIVNINKEERVVEELDLELRLGHIPTSDGGLIKKNNDNNGAVFRWR